MTAWKYRDLKGVKKNGRGSRYNSNLTSHKIYKDNAQEMKELGVSSEAFNDIVATYYEKVFETLANKFAVHIKHIGVLYIQKNRIDSFTNEAFFRRNKKRDSLYNQYWFYKAKIQFQFPGYASHLKPKATRHLRIRWDKNYAKPFLTNLYKDPSFNPHEFDKYVRF